MIQLKDLCQKASSNIAQKDLEGHEGQYPIYGASGLIGYVDFYKQENPYVAVVKDGAGIGRVMCLPEKSSVIGTMQYILPNEGVNVHYLAFAMEHMNLAKYFSGATIPHIYFKDYGKEKLLERTEKEQKSIAEILSKMDSLISLRKQQIAKLDELVKARFVEMFGDINVNNKKWMTYPLGELCTIVRGGSPRPIERYLGGTIPWIKIGDATTGENIYLNSTKEYIIQEGVKKSRMIKAGSLIFANCGVSLGFARIITFDGCIHDGWLAMEDIDEKLDKIFLLYSLNQMTEYFRKTAPAGTQPNLNTNIMKMHRQIVPPMEMQKAFISFVKCADRQKQIVQQSLDKLELMKKALMQEYFG